MPAVWLFVFSGVAWRWRRTGRRLAVLGAALLVLSSVPAFGRLLSFPLSAVADQHTSLTGFGADAIVVPTAGAFRDATGRWWPKEGTIRRVVVGLELQARLDLPMIVSGGAPFGQDVPESRTLAEVMLWPADGVRLETTARNSAETARAVAEILAADGARKVLLITDRNHIRRMGAALRRQGLVVASVEAVSPKPEADMDRSWSWRDFVPAESGMDITAGALREYVGIGWYLLRGYIRIRDL